MSTPQHSVLSTLKSIGTSVGRFIMACLLFYIFMKMEYCYWILLAL